MIQSGQKFTRPATKGTAPRKNQGLAVKIPAAISARPSVIRIGRQAALIFITFIIYSPIIFKVRNYSEKDECI